MANYTIHSEVYGPYKNFSHILVNTDTNKAVIFDPAWDANYLAKRINDLGVELEAIWLTHGHHDHVSAIDDLRAIFPVPVYASEVEIDYINSFTPEELPKAFLPIPSDTIRLKDGETITLDDIEVKILHTPGHSSGSICFLLEDDIITGDTLFVDGCGRADIPGSDPKVLYQSLNRLVKKVPHHVTIHTGHAYGPTDTDTLAHQIESNPYLQYALLSEKDFLTFRNRT